MPTVTQCEYGHYTHGRPYSSGQTWFRMDVYTSHMGGEGGRDRLFVAGPDDDSPIYHTPYNAGCSCCYLGFAHSKNAHSQREGVPS